MQFLGNLFMLVAIVVPVFSELTSANDTVYVGTGESVILLCNVTPNMYSTPRWTGPDVNKKFSSLYSVGLEINLALQNARKLVIMANMSEGKYNLKIKNASLNEEGIYICSFVNQESFIKDYVIQLKIKVPAKNITIHGADSGILHGTEYLSLVLNCSVISGMPPEPILWFNESLLLGIGGPRTFELNIIPQKYDHGKIYTCIVNSSVLMGAVHENVQLDIKYPPSIKIKTDLDKKVLQCIPNGEPNTYKFYPWIHQSDHGDVIRYLHSTETIHLQTNGATLNLYQYNGIYVCRVENGVSYINGTVIQSGQVFVRHLDKPVFVSRNEYKQYGITGTEIDIKVFVYSYPFFHKLKVKTRGFLSIDNNKINVEHAPVFDRIYSNEFRMKGFKITLHGFMVETNDFTSYTFWIENSVGYANFTVDLIDVEKLSGRTLNIYTQISSSLIGGLLLGIACTIFWNCVRKQMRKNELQQVHQEEHYDEIELVDQNLVLNQQQTYHPVDTNNVIVQDPNSGNSGNHNTSESNSSEAMSSRPLSFASEQHDYENSYQPLDLDNSEKRLYDEAQVCSINIVATENTYVNTVL